MKGFADCHIHIRGGNFEKIQKLLDDAHSMGITDAALMALPFHSISENIATLYWKMNYKKMRITAFGGMHLTDQYADVPFEKQAERLLDLGCDGIKLIDMHPELIEYTKRFTSHTDYDRMFSMLEERSTPVLMHTNGPKECWEASDAGMPAGLAVYQGACLGREIPTYEEIYHETLAMLNKHPKLKLVIAHFFSLSSNIERATYIMETYPNVSFDLTPGTDMYFHFMKKPEKWHDFFTKYQDRLLFGTDANAYKDYNKEIVELVYTFITHDYTPFTMPCYGNYEICGLGLSEDVVEKICYTNYLNMIGHDIKPVDVDGVYDAAEIVLKEIKENLNPYYEKAKILLSGPNEEWSPEQKTARVFFERMLKERKQ